MATKLEKLGIKDTREFGAKYRTLINKLNKGNNNGEYVGYQLSTHRDQLTIIGKTGTLLINIVDYDNFPSKGSFIPILASAVHYKKGGNVHVIKFGDNVHIPSINATGIVYKVEGNKLTVKTIGGLEVVDIKDVEYVKDFKKGGNINNQLTYEIGGL